MFIYKIAKKIHTKAFPGNLVSGRNWKMFSNKRNANGNFKTEQL